MTQNFLPLLLLPLLPLLLSFRPSQADPLPGRGREHTWCHQLALGTVEEEGEEEEEEGEEEEGEGEEEEEEEEGGERTGAIQKTTTVVR